ncbi:MAG: hypothetical protein E7652_00495 [Ruminococcaceae bacterium]|nr:hypothetical protein [Oscillospiraceae bacterium]
MKKYLIFDDVFPGRHFERSFFKFCLIKQLSLIRFLPLYLVYNFLYFFRIKKREAYLSVRWSFIGEVKALDVKIESFLNRKMKRVYIPDKDVCILSEHPRQLLENRFDSLTANIYDCEKRSFPCFKRSFDFIEEEHYEAYGAMFTSVMRNAAVRHYIRGKKVFGSAAAYIAKVVFHYAVSYSVMTAWSFAIGLSTLYFACRHHLQHANIFFSYLERPTVLLLNVMPVVFLCWLLYFIFNNTAIACLLSSGICLVLSWINYYKIFFRNDPFLFGDLAIAMEAKMMTESYKVVLTPLIKVMIIAVILFAVVMLIYFRAPIKNLFIRLICLVLTVLIGYNCFVNVYLDVDKYTEALDGRYIKAWATNEHFISRGFLYPFIYSYKDAFDTEPEGYNEEYAVSLLSDYKYADIPEEKKVNVISIMLESWGDFSKFESVEFLEGKNPYEMLEPLYEMSYHGELVNDIFSAGTVNTERQFLTGLNKLFNFRKPTNSYAWYFADQGYTVEGGHPCHDWFYNRQNINRNLGFEKYYFDQNRYLDLTGKYNCTDSEMFPDIMTLFDAAMDRGEDYFSFNVTYEGHGPYAYDVKYPYEYIERKDISEQNFNNFNNYLAKMESVNKAVTELADEVMDRDEPLVLILFGDHMPGLGENNSGYASLGINIDLSTEEGFLNYYSTPYVILANDAAKKTLDNDFTGQGPTIGPCFLMTEFFRQAGYIGDEYMQYLADMYKEFQVYHSFGVIMDEGKLMLKDYSDYSKSKSDFNIVQYYRRNEFIYG